MEFYSFQSVFTIKATCMPVGRTFGKLGRGSLEVKRKALKKYIVYSKSQKL